MKTVKGRPHGLANFRLPLAVALSSCAGIAVAYFSEYYFGTLNFASYAILVAIAIFLGAVILKRKIKAALYALILFSAFVAFCAYCGGVLEALSYTEATENITYGICGVVCGSGADSTGEPYIILTQVRLNGEAVKGNMIVNFLPEIFSEPTNGDKLHFYSEIYKYDTFGYGKLHYMISQGVKYRACPAGMVETEHSFLPSGQICSALKRVLFDNLESETAAVSFAMLTGNSAYVSDGTLSSFRFGGVAHIFAVSGLHIGLVYGALSRGCKLVNMNTFVSAVVKVAAIVFYCAVCGYTPSSVRATVMCTVSAFAGVVHKKYDGLNALSLAVIILFCINPLNLFDLGFILSVSALIGITFLIHPLRKGFKALPIIRRFPAKIRDGLAVSLSATAGTIPAQLAYFGYLSCAGILLNVFVLPVLSLFFVAIFACALVSVITPPFVHFLLPAVCRPLEFIINGAVEIGFENAALHAYGGWIFTIFYFIALIVLSDKIRIKRGFRAAVACCCTAVIFFSSLFSAMPPKSYSSVYITAYTDAGAVLFRNSVGTVLVVTDGYGGYGVERFLSNAGVGKPDAVVVVGGEDCIQTYNGLRLSVRDVYMEKSLFRLGAIDGASVHYESDFGVLSYEFSFIDSHTVTVKTDGVTFAVTDGKGEESFCADFVVSAGKTEYINAEQVAYFDCYTGRYDIYECGDLQFTVKDGKLNKSRFNREVL